MDSKSTDRAYVQNILTRGVSDIIVKDELIKLLEEGRPLRLKMGFDPSRPDIHLGHAVGLRKLRQFQELGHKVILIVGDWTAQIGDPSGQSATRQMLTAEEVRKNAETYMEQFFRVIDKDRTQTVWQSEWFGKFDLAKVFDLTRRFTVAQFLARDDFAQRFKAQKPIAITELLYPLLQAYDSVEIESNVEFGGTDQSFILLVGRELQGMMGQTPQQCLIMPLLVGTDGVQKMSKSLGNYIGVQDPPDEMYGKIMSISDSVMMDYFELLTDIPDTDINEMKKALASESVNPMELKKKLASEIVLQYYDKKAAIESQSGFESVVQRGEIPAEAITQIPAPMQVDTGEKVDLVQFLVDLKLSKSTSEAKRLLEQKAIKIDGSTLEERYCPLYTGSLIQAGKRRFFRIVSPKTL